MNPLNKPPSDFAAQGQGVVEYAGALVVATVAVGVAIIGAGNIGSILIQVLSNIAAFLSSMAPQGF